MLEYKFIPYKDKDGIIKYKTIGLEKYSNSKEYDKAIKQKRDILKRKSFYKKSIKFFLIKLGQPHLYPTKSLWNEFMRIACGVYYEGMWYDFEDRLIKIARVLAVRD